MKTILIVTGGTGGHIFPALAVGEKLSVTGINPVFIVRKCKNDCELIKQYGFKYMTIPASGFFGKSIREIIFFFLNYIKAMLRFPLIMTKLKPVALVITGGFTSFVPALWAVSLQKNFFLLEQNRIPGRLTKYFSAWAREIYLGFPLLKQFKGNVVYTGNPVRSTILTNHHQNDGHTVVVLGGSQGAMFLNLNIVELATQMPDLTFIIQTGKRNYDLVRKLIKSNNCELIDFTQSPEGLYQRATIIISRAGGMVLSEILLFGIPSILVPFPFATDNHQAANAQFLAQNNAAIILKQDRQQGLSNNFVLQLNKILRGLLNNKQQLNQMSKNAKAIAKRNAATIIAQRIIKCLEK